MYSKQIFPLETMNTNSLYTIHYSQLITFKTVNLAVNYECMWKNFFFSMYTTSKWKPNLFVLIVFGCRVINFLIELLGVTLAPVQTPAFFSFSRLMSDLTGIDFHSLVCFKWTDGPAFSSQNIATLLELATCLGPELVDALKTPAEADDGNFHSMSLGVIYQKMLVKRKVKKSKNYINF